MRFGPLAVGDALGAVLAHTTRAGERVLKKGRVLAAADLAALAAAGLAQVVCAVLAPGEIDEDAAAAAVAEALGGGALRLDHTGTGRTNLHAATGGVVDVDPAAIAAANAVGEAIAISTLAAYAPVAAGDLVATVKVIPFAVPGAEVEAARAAAREGVAVRAWRGRRAGLVLTRFASTAASVLDRAATAQRTRLARCGATLVREERVAHDAGEVAAAIGGLVADGADLVLVLGASAIMDRADVIPAGLERAGGRVLRFGIPVDPGNLLLLGALGDAVVLGVPGCARSLTRSGFDWVLERACAGLPLAPAALAGLGVGGLLDEGNSRPSPRAPAPAPDAAPPAIAAIVLAAGRATRMGHNKLLAELAGAPVVRHTVTAALASGARPVVVVLGHQATEVRAALAGLAVDFVENPAYADGMATSLAAGVRAVEALAPAAGGALVCLGDMPRLRGPLLDAVIAAARVAGDAAIVVPTCERKRGHPVLWPRRYFAEIAALTGDVGARAVVDRYPDHVALVALDDPAILLDVDTPQALAALADEEIG